MEFLKIILPIFLLGIFIIFLIKKLEGKYKNKNLEDRNSKNSGNYIGEGIGLGLVFGAAFGSIFNNMVLWIPIGMMFGLIVGQAIEKKEA